jgi:hypothetical protein
LFLEGVDDLVGFPVAKDPNLLAMAFWYLIALAFASGPFVC